MNIEFQGILWYVFPAHPCIHFKDEYVFVFFDIPIYLMFLLSSPLRYHIGLFFAVYVILRRFSRRAVRCGAWRGEFSWAAMLTLASKLKRDDAGKTGRASGPPESTHRVSIRDRLLTKGTTFITGKIILETPSKAYTFKRVPSKKCSNKYLWFYLEKYQWLL